MSGPSSHFFYYSVFKSTSELTISHSKTVETATRFQELGEPLPIYIEGCCVSS